MPTLNKRATLIVLTGPFACGKTSIAKQMAPEFRKCTTATTRAPRAGEVDGKDYHFMSRIDFENAHTVRNEFLETAENNGELYGTPRLEVDVGIRRGDNMVICLDPQGVESLLQDPNEDLQDALITFYIEISLDEAIRRYLLREKNFSYSDLTRRIATREKEEQMKHLCQYRLPNPTGELEATAAKIKRMAARRYKERECNV